MYTGTCLCLCTCVYYLHLLRIVGMVMHGKFAPEPMAEISIRCYPPPPPSREHLLSHTHPCQSRHVTLIAVALQPSGTITSSVVDK